MRNSIRTLGEFASNSELELPFLKVPCCPPMDQSIQNALTATMSLDTGMASFGFAIGVTAMMATNAIAKIPTFKSTFGALNNPLFDDSARFFNSPMLSYTSTLLARSSPATGGFYTRSKSIATCQSKIALLPSSRAYLLQDSLTHDSFLSQNRGNTWPPEPHLPTSWVLSLAPRNTSWS